MSTPSVNRNPKPLLSVEETAFLLGETGSTLYQSVKAGTLRLPMSRIGSRIQIPRRAVERLIEGMEPEQSSPSSQFSSWRGHGQRSAASSPGR